MQTIFSRASLAVAAVAMLASTAFAAPSATQYQSALTDPPVATGSTIKITKPSKIQIKVSANNVTFTLKLNGVTDAGDAPVNLANNTAQIDIIKPSGALATVMYNFTITNGKVNLKTTVDNATVGFAVGQTIDIRRVRLVQAVAGVDFAVAGLTAK